MTEAVVLVAGYLIGSIDFAVLAARRHGVDIYSEGSGNPGASNVARVIGKRTGALVMVADLLKGVVAAGLGELVGGSEFLGFAAGGLAVAGHCFPVWHRFRGGKGVATTVGVLLWTIPLLGLGLAMVWAAIIGATRVSSYGSLTVVLAAVPAVWLWAEESKSALVMAGITVLVVIRHAGNIKRMLGSGEQSL
ncbi:MAG: glycerol-3-phosphate 1-O-acyltransferase PlsY [Acidimicrobiia bacterium]|nr:glycerol-3-phosphate 1-O-acyltransferase PlsY [Acidimicrobiia bacterium]MBT8215617.1 glycerol-3-phosphate 1-O-acyltransferase PlsY [Acidimicrobiia bacterium]NNF10800.1 glycerol-3-phosphate 1-O-acyltransferase PlsY [Acidimicrobiia bacterium]NNL68327.1 glycerol-3-phosphate 1-O-acyltransferase PlsY [Acidimicrobiia bacterium]